MAIGANHWLKDNEKVLSVYNRQKIDVLAEIAIEGCLSEPNQKCVRIV